MQSKFAVFGNFNMTWIHLNVSLRKYGVIRIDRTYEWTTPHGSFVPGLAPTGRHGDGAFRAFGTLITLLAVASVMKTLLRFSHN